MHRAIAILIMTSCVFMPALALAADDAAAAVHDPMQPTWLRGSDERSKPERSPTQRFSVDTIVVSPERRVAIINGRSVGVGEWVHGAKVLRINPDAVTLELDGARFTIALAISDIKKASRNGG